MQILPTHLKTYLLSTHNQYHNSNNQIPGRQLSSLTQSKATGRLFPHQSSSRSVSSRTILSSNLQQATHSLQCQFSNQPQLSTNLPLNSNHSQQYQFRNSANNLSSNPLNSMHHPKHRNFNLSNQLSSHNNSLHSTTNKPNSNTNITNLVFQKLTLLHFQLTNGLKLIF